MKLTESELSETLGMDNPLLYEPNVILDNGYGNYTHKLIIKHFKMSQVGNVKQMLFRVLFNPETMSIKLNNAFLQAGIDPYNINQCNFSNETNNFELINCVYCDFDRDSDKEKYNGIKDYVNSIKKYDNPDIEIIYGIKINKGEYSASRGTYSVKVSGGYYYPKIMIDNI